MKTKQERLNGLYPMLTVIVGAHVDDRPNFITIAHVGIIDFQHISISSGKIHYTNAGIRENHAFSVNVPSSRMVKETDYCGLVSGRNEDKTKFFTVFYGSLETAPMIAECPINMECRLVQTLEYPKHDIFIGRIVETYCDDACMNGEAVDFAKVDPLFFTMDGPSYWRLGEPFGKAWDVGKELRGQ